jgi:hypothetical protein
MTREKTVRNVLLILLLSMTVFFIWDYRLTISSFFSSKSTSSGGKVISFENTTNTTAIGDCLMGPYTAVYKGYYKSIHVGSDSESLVLSDANHYDYKSDIKAGFLFWHYHLFNESKGEFTQNGIVPKYTTVFDSHSNKTSHYAISKGNVDIESVFLIARQHLLSGDTRPLNLSVQKDGHGGKYSVRLILKNLPSFRMDTVLGKNIKVEKVSYKNHQGFTYALYLAPNYFYFPVEVVQYKPNGSEQIKLILDKVTLQKSSSCIYRQKKSA